MNSPYYAKGKFLAFGIQAWVNDQIDPVEKVVTCRAAYYGLHDSTTSKFAEILFFENGLILGVTRQTKYENGGSWQIPKDKTIDESIDCIREFLTTKEADAEVCSTN